MSTLLVDYLDHRQAFDEVLSGHPPLRRILLIKGDSGTGKTTLLTHCLRSIPEDSLVVKIQLRGSVVAVAEIFSRIGHVLGWERLPTFTGLVAKFQETPNVRIDGNWLAGINNHIDVALQTPDTTVREHRRAALTNAIFSDLAQLGREVLLVFDTYEQATEEMKAWISGPFLSRVAEAQPVRVVVAGQRIPDANNIEWGDCCRTQELRGVPDVDHWWPLVESMNWQIDAEDPKSYLKAVCSVYKGKPDDIMKYLTTLPRDEG